MNSIKIIIGLGNPDKKYFYTRHNIGYLVLDNLLNKFFINSNQWKLKDLWVESKISIEKQELYLIKPITYMNLSGKAVSKFLLKYHLNIDQILVIHDDLDLDWGVLKIKNDGGSGGHKGIESCILELNETKFLRLRIGIGRPQNCFDVSGFVLSEFDNDQKKELNIVLDKAAEAIQVILKEGIVKAMNRFNKKNTVQKHDQN